MDDGIATRLAVYGSLAPGRANHHELAGLSGEWREGIVHGHFHPDGWGAALGYPAIVLDPAGPGVPVQVFTSPDLPAHWVRLDAFEGDGYRRIPCEAMTASGAVSAYIYALAESPTAL